MSESFKELFSSNDNAIIINKFVSLLSEKKEKLAQKFLYELIYFSTEEINLIKNIKSLINSLKDKYNNNSLIKEFIDNYIVQTLWIVGFNITISPSNINSSEHDKIKNENFKNLVNLLLSEEIIKKIDLLEKLDKSTLNQIGLFPEQDYKKIFRLKITSLYEQNKFNLLREESEGYSKLISLLFDLNELNKKLNEKDIQITLEEITKTIGYFNLDSYRVLDIALDVFKYSPFNINYIKIFDILNKEKILTIIDCKFFENLNDKKLMIVVAQLIHFNYISLEEFLLHITPSLNELQQNFVKKYQTIYDYINKSLIQDIKHEISSFVENTETFSKEKSEANKSHKIANHFCNFQKIISKAINFEIDEDKNNKEDKRLKKVNQFYLLFESFIAIKDKENIDKMYNLVKDFYDPLENDGVIYELCELIKWMINPLYNNEVEPESNSNEENKSDLICRCYSFEDFINKVWEYLKILSIGLSKDQILFQKIIKIMKNNVKEIKINTKYIDFFNNLFVELFFPSLSLIDPCPSLLILIWNYLSNFDYRTRYKLYENWLVNSYTIHPYLIIRKIIVSKEIEKWNKSISSENARKNGRILQIITNSNPTLVFDFIIGIAIKYENQINTIVSTFNFCSDLSRDAITYSICKLLLENKIANIDKDSIAIDKEFKNFCDFISYFYKKYYSSEINGLINFIIDKLNKSPENMDIFILKELMEKMTGIKTQNDGEIISESGGYNFYLECKYSRKEINTFKKPTNALMKGIQNNDNFISLFLLLNLQKRKILYLNKLNFRLMSFIYDQIHLINLQFQKLLKYFVKENIFIKISDVLTSDILIKKYHFTPQTIFRLLRKNGHKIYELTKEEYIKNINQYKEIYDEYINYKKEFLENEYDTSYLDKSNFVSEFYRPFWTSITPEFFFIFNYLELEDIFFPKSEYNKKITDLNNEAKQDPNGSKIKDVLKDLTEEEKHLSSHNQKVLDFLKNKFENVLNQNSLSVNNIESKNDKNNSEKEKKEDNDKSIKKEENKSLPKLMDIEEKDKEKKIDKKNMINKKELTQSLIQYLFYPRIIISKGDSLYVQKLINLLIIYKGDTINTIDIMNKIPKFLLKEILCVTECEAENIGIFLNSFLNDIKSFQSEQFWDKNCKHNISFSRKLEEISFVDLKDFKNAFDELIKNLTNSIETMLRNEKDYLNIRNIIIMLSKMPKIIPPTKEKARSLLTVLNEIYNTNQDFILLKSYINELETNFKSKPDNDNNDNNNDDNHPRHKRDKSHSRKSENKKRDRERSRERSKDGEKSRDRDRDRDKNRDKDRYNRERDRDDRKNNRNSERRRYGKDKK